MDSLTFMITISVVLAAGLAIFYMLTRKPPAKKRATVVEKEVLSGIPISYQSSRKDAKTLSYDTGRVAPVKRMGISADMMILACALSGFGLFMYAYLVPNGALFATLVGGIIFIPIGVMIGAMFSGAMRIKIMRRLTGRNYGVVKFIHSSRLIKPVIANLDNDIIKFSNGIYMVDKNNIKREGESAHSSDFIEDSKIKFEEGVPTIYYDIEDIIPVDFANRIEKARGEDKFRLPTQVSATLNKEIAVEKEKIMNSFSGRQNMAMILILVLVAVNIYLTWSIFSSQDNMNAAISSLNTAVSSLKEALAIIIARG